MDARLRQELRRGRQIHADQGKSEDGCKEQGAPSKRESETGGRKSEGRGQRTTGCGPWADSLLGWSGGVLFGFGLLKLGQFLFPLGGLGGAVGGFVKLHQALEGLLEARSVVCDQTLTRRCRLRCRSVQLQLRTFTRPITYHHARLRAPRAGPQGYTAPGVRVQGESLVPFPIASISIRDGTVVVRIEPGRSKKSKNRPVEHRGAGKSRTLVP